MILPVYIKILIINILVFDLDTNLHNKMELNNKWNFISTLEIKRYKKQLWSQKEVVTTGTKPPEIFYLVYIWESQVTTV